MKLGRVRPNKAEGRKRAMGDENKNNTSIKGTGDAGSTPGGSGAAQNPDGGVSTPGWQATLPPGIRGNEALAKVKDVSELAKSYLELTDKVAGKPASIDQYVFNAPADVAIDAEAVAQFKELAFNLGMPADAANKLFEFALQRDLEGQKKLKEAMDKELAAGEEAMAKAWGNDKEANRALASRVVQRFGGKEVEDALAVTGLGRNFTLVNFLYKVGKAMSESALKDPSNSEAPNKRRIETMPDGRPMLSFPSMDNIQPFTGY